MRYTIILSGINGTGKYVLKLIQAQPLTLGSPIKGTISYDKDKIPTSAYYYFNSTDPFTVKLDTQPVDTRAGNTLQWNLVVRQADPTFNDYSDVFNYTDNRNVISSTALTILGSNKVIALGVHPGGYSFGDNTIGANQDFTLTVSTAK